MKLVGGVDGDEPGLIVGLLLRLIPAPMEEKQKLHRLRRRNWRRNEGTQAMAKACWLVSLCFSSVYLLSFCSSFLSFASVLSLLRRNGCCYCGTRWRPVWGYVDREGYFRCRGRNGWGAVVGQEREDEGEDSSS
jgi:hypothetical protein